MTILRRHDPTYSSSASRRAFTNSGAAGLNEPRPVLITYRLADFPGDWLTMVARPGTDLEDARRRLAHQFGADRVLEVREHLPHSTQQRET